MKLATRLGIVTAASVALIGGAAFAAPSFAVDSTESPQTHSQEQRQLHRDAQSAERSEDCDHTEAEKAEHRAERQAEREAHGQDEGKRMGVRGKGSHSES